MKTAIELLENELSEWIHYQYEKAYEQHQKVNAIFDKYKQLEKEQIIQSYNDGYVNKAFDKPRNPLEYYNETYNQNER